MIDHSSKCLCHKCIHEEPRMLKVIGFIHPVHGVHVPDSIECNSHRVWFVNCTVDDVPHHMVLDTWNERAEEGTYYVEGSS